jgi:Uma2 family endonuclease
MKKISGYNIPLHQEVISDFIYHIRRHLQQRGWQYEFKVAPEVVLRNEDFKDGYIIPDVSVKKRESSWNQPEMIIEVTRNRSWNTDIKKVRKAIKEIRSLKEVFVFNIEESECWRISKPDFDEEDGNSFSGVLRFDLKNCLRG